MPGLIENFRNASPRSQLAVFALGFLLLAALLATGYFALRPNYQVLFRDLRPQDAATIVAELERQKVGYRLEDGGATILVPQSSVHAVRLNVMSKDLPLKGTVGFELFNTSDLGLTEFAQKVNYQRALQGELARTIMSLSEVEAARVHIAFPESGLFRRGGSKPKASVTVVPADGRTLQPETVRGIQRLVAAAVPELETADVAVLDQRGAPATGMALAGSGVGDPKLEAKAELERYYARKILEQLEAIVGKGNVLISVDAALNFDQVRVTQETSSTRRVTAPRLPAAPAAVVPPEGGAEPVALRAPPVAPARDESVKRLEQIVSTPGSVRRLTIGVLLKMHGDKSLLERIREQVAATVGASADRGDVISLFAQDSFAAEAAATPRSEPAMLASAPPATAASNAQPGPAAPLAADWLDSPKLWVIAALAVAGAALILLAAAALRARRLRSLPVRRLTHEERAATADRLRELLKQADPHAARG